ncbi:group II intron reverse transcriptase/maturase [Streptomyces sp. NPDC003952]
MNTSAWWPTSDEAWSPVRKIQTKLHRWATDDPGRRFDDLYNLVCDPAVLTMAWEQVQGNRGARTAGVDGVVPRSIVFGTEAFLTGLRDDLKARRFAPMPVRERLIPKPGSSKMRMLGIPTARDRTVQAALKLVLEPIFEADFHPCSYGFRPRRRAHDAIAEIRQFASQTYEWVLEGDIKACFDEISHTALMGRVRKRIGDKRVLALVKSFLKAGILGEDGFNRDTAAGTPQGGIVSPLLANIALSALDDHFAEHWQTHSSTYTDRSRRRRHKLPNYRMVRYADDFVVLVSGSEADARALKGEVAQVLAPMGLRLSEEKTTICHIDQGFDFLGYRIQRHRKRGTSQIYVYTYPSKKALTSITEKVRKLTWRDMNPSLEVTLHRLNPVLRGWTNYFRYGVSKGTLNYLRAFTWRRVVGWLRRKYLKLNWKQIRRRYLPGWWPTDGEVVLFNPAAVTVTYYRYRGTRIPSPWPTRVAGSDA